MICPHEHIVQKGWRIEIPYEDKVDVLTPINILFIWGGDFRLWSVVKIKTPTNKLFKGVANFDTSWRYSCLFYPNQHIVHKGWRIVIPYEDKVDAMTPISKLFIEGGELWSLMKIKLMFLPRSTYCSHEVSILIRYEDKDDVITPTNRLFKGVANFDPSWR